MSETKANWQDINVASLAEKAQMAYSEYKDAQRKAAMLRTEFETLVTASLELPVGRKMVFGYRFGKLSAALVADDGKKAKSQSKGSLADFLTAQMSNGHAA